MQPSRLPEGLDTLNPEGGLALFTDGSSWTKDGSGGWAWIALDGYEGEANHSGGAGGTTNNRMEMMAWIEGLATMFATFGTLGEVLVCSDSEYVGLGVMDPTRNRRQNRDLWQALDDAVGLHGSVVFIYVRGHSGDEYNERVDKLASKARKEWRQGR